MPIAQTVQVVATMKYLRDFGLALGQTNKQKLKKSHPEGSWLSPHATDWTLSRK